MDNLEIIDKKISVINNKIHFLIKQALYPENMHIAKDAKWGQRSIQLIIRLDEFDPNKLQNILPQLIKLYHRYQELRNTEIKLLNLIQIEAAKENQLF